MLIRNDEAVSSILQRLLPRVPPEMIQDAELTPSEQAGQLRLLSTQHGRVRRLYAVSPPKPVPPLVPPSAPLTRASGGREAIIWTASIW